MSELVDLDDIKAHLRLESDDVEEDTYLAALVMAARRTCEQRLSRPLVGSDVDLTEDDLIAAAQAVRLIVGHWHRNREAVAVDQQGVPAEIPLAVTWLLAPLVKFATE